ncbi:MAG TPA: hypothetical protein VGQ83_05130 [Polyangia bacterium]
MPPTRKGPQLLAAALGVNLWATMVLVPALYLRASAQSAVLLWLVCALAPLLLMAGVWWRSRWLLLLAFPGALVAAPAVEPALAGPSVYTAATLLPCAAALLLHFAGSLFLVAAAAAPPPPVRVRAIDPAAPPARARRQLRLYRAFAVGAGALLAAMLAAVHYRPSARADLARSFGVSPEAAITVIDLAILGLWAGMFLVYFVAPLSLHLDGDRVTLAENAAARWRLRGRPGAPLYVAMFVALTLLATLWALRYR